MTPKIAIVDLVSGASDKRYEPAGRMAGVIVAVTRDNGDCRPQDLSREGFTPDEIQRHWHLANSLAAVELRLTGEKPAGD